MRNASQVKFTPRREYFSSSYRCIHFTVIHQLIINTNGEYTPASLRYTLISFAFDYAL